jgi:hypothetical protein
VDGRSAKELAKIWMKKGKPQVPIELTELLKSHSGLGRLVIDLVIPEYETQLDKYGKGRTHDLLIYCKSDNKNVIVSIEAKAGEPFGPTIKERLKNNPIDSNIDKRIAQLSQALFSQVWRYVSNNDVSDLFGYATPDEIVQYYQYWESVDDGMSDYVRDLMLRKIWNDSLWKCKTPDEVVEWERKAIKELERRVRNSVRKNSG